MHTSTPGSGLTKGADHLTTQVTTEEGIRFQNQEARRGIVWGTYRFIREWPLVPLAIIAMFLVFAIFADVISGKDQFNGELYDRNTPPMWYPEGSSSYLLGADQLGRDIFTRIMHGTRISLMFVGVVLTSGAIAGTSLGLISGWYGGITDEFIQRSIELLIALPFLLVAFVFVIVFSPSLPMIITLLVLFSWGGFARIVRAETLQLKNMDYVSLARIAGASTTRILSRHILPGVVNTVVVLVSLQVGALIITESILSYLGVGIQPPTPAWGVMVKDGFDYLVVAPWVSMYPALAIALTVLAFNFLGDWLRDRLDPRLRQLV